MWGTCNAFARPAQHLRGSLCTFTRLRGLQVDWWVHLFRKLQPLRQQIIATSRYTVCSGLQCVAVLGLTFSNDSNLHNPRNGRKFVITIMSKRTSTSMGSKEPLSNQILYKSMTASAQTSTTSKRISSLAFLLERNGARMQKLSLPPRRTTRSTQRGF